MSNSADLTLPRIPKEVDYADIPAKIPDDTNGRQIVVRPSNAQTFTENQEIVFDLPSSGYLDPTSLYLRYEMVITQNATASDLYILGTPAVSPISSSSVFFGSQQVENINNYNVLYNMMVNLNYSISDKLSAVNLSFITPSTQTFATTNDPTFKNVDGLEIPQGAKTSTLSFAFPVANCLTLSEGKLIPLEMMDLVRMTFRLDSIANYLTPTANVDAVSFKNFELVYHSVDMPSSVNFGVQRLGSFNIKTSTWGALSQTLGASQGSIDLIFNARYSSIKSLFTCYSRNDATKCVNRLFDSIDVSQKNGSYQYLVDGVAIPQYPITTYQNRYGGFLELKRAVKSGLNHAESNEMAITADAYNYGFGDVTSVFTTGKYYVGVDCERIASNQVLLSGVSSKNSPISLRLLLNTATTASTTVTMFILADALIAIDTMTKTANLIK